MRANHVEVVWYLLVMAWKTHESEWNAVECHVRGVRFDGNDE